MLHLSLITLPRESLKWRFLKPYELHQTLWKGFGNLKSSGQKERFLYRHNELSDVHSVLVQSATEPDWSFLADEADGSVVQMKSFDPLTISAEKPLRFMLRANPVVTRKYPDGKKRRIAVGSDRKRLQKILNVENLNDLPTREEMLIQWLQKCGDEKGFSIISTSSSNGDRVLCDVGPNRDVILRKPKQKSTNNRITITSVDFTGMLRVTDVQKFATTMQTGIGRARRFGCGLLSVAVG